MAKIKYVIVQAGGRGSRMERLTRNKPKALVPVGNQPMLLRLFKTFSGCHFIVIGDWKADVLERYLSVFSSEDWQLVRSTGKRGTCAGVTQALSLVPAGEPFVLIWSDLVLPTGFDVGDVEGNAIGLSADFPCRWKYENSVFAEERSTERGVAGLFAFRDKGVLQGVSEEGEFVRWLQERRIGFEREIALHRTREVGILSEWEKLPRSRCRPFNCIEEIGGQIVKTALDDQGRLLAAREVAWYELMAERFGKSENLPVVYGFSPLRMERIDGKNVFEYEDLPIDQKRLILRRIVSCLKRVHAVDSCPSSKESFDEAYITKTFARLEKIRTLVPFAQERTVVINGRSCRNVFTHKEELSERILRFFPHEFCVIHGDCTFSNIMLRHGETPVLIDPRGYFGTTQIYGDEAYDWAKLYYSLVTNYDQFNLKRFDLEITDKDVHLSIRSNGWEDLEEDFFALTEGRVTSEQIKLIVAVIWLSLTTYAWEDYDSICGAFYNGLLLLEDAL